MPAIEIEQLGRTGSFAGSAAMHGGDDRRLALAGGLQEGAGRRARRRRRKDPAAPGRPAPPSPSARPSLRPGDARHTASAARRPREAGARSHPARLSVRSSRSGPLSSRFTTAEPRAPAPSAAAPARAAARSARTARAEQDAAFPEVEHLRQPRAWKPIATEPSCRRRSARSARRRLSGGVAMVLGDRRVGEAGLGQRLDQPVPLPAGLRRRSQCCSAQPPQPWRKWRQGGATRSGARLSTASDLGGQRPPRLVVRRARTCSPGRACRGRKPAAPSRRGDAVAGRAQRVDRQFQSMRHHPAGANALGGRRIHAGTAPSATISAHHAGDQQHAQHPGDPQAEEDSDEGHDDQRASRIAANTQAAMALCAHMRPRESAGCSAGDGGARAVADARSRSIRRASRPASRFSRPKMPVEQEGRGDRLGSRARSPRHRAPSRQAGRAVPVSRRPCGACQPPKAFSPVCARPRIRAWTSCAPS